MLRYKLGNELRNLDNRLIDENSRIITKNKEHADIITRTMIDGLRKIKNKVNNWQKLDHQKITELLRKNVQVTSTAGHADNKSWSRLRRSSKNLKRLDLNYLIAHTRLPLANFLSSINITNDSRCRLCGQEPETQEHLFFHCPLIQDLIAITKQDLQILNRSSINLTCSLITMHKNIKFASQMNEIISIFKQCIWQVRGALIWGGHQINIHEELRKLYLWKSRFIVRRLDER